ncbi:hypothetical protein OAT84_01385 [Gammaproteobacteria bacterium]|nr:hypothetical protein [Gammaproteobacteria bacterium]
MKDLMIRALPLLCLAFISAEINLLKEPAENAEIIATISPEHELEMHASEWVKVHNKTTNQSGWAKLSELREKLNNGSQWEFSYDPTNNNSQRISYRPISSEEVSKQMSQIKRSHEAIIKKFEKALAPS